ncbi:FG-GAP-like repeat-containing protein [Janthinobacterium sp. Ant5-2-1]|uniref:FG-GAP-like repeat-containing protein n=1 Tax=Janthinobacterium sp. Ant5-2-1 TaxID=1755239 RepID=UPI000AA6A792|nr:FG-GAP-like repeat-containing protein [Janthinobacterium sp. Ant5-2-1]
MNKKNHKIAIAILFLSIFSGCGSSSSITSDESTSEKEPSVPVVQESAPLQKDGDNTTISTDMYIVAHQDDELLFLSQPLQQSVAKGNRVVTVFLTNGAVQVGGNDTHGNPNPPPPASLQELCKMPNSGNIEVLKYIDTSSLQGCYESIAGLNRIAASLSAYRTMLGLPVTNTPADWLRRWLDASNIIDSRKKTDDVINQLISANCKVSKTITGSSTLLPSIHCSMQGKKTLPDGSIVDGSIVDLFYLGLPETEGWSDGSAENILPYEYTAGSQIRSLEALWKDTTLTSTTNSTYTFADETGKQYLISYTRPQLLLFLSTLMSTFQPNIIGTLDSTKTFYDVFFRDGLPLASTAADHGDHIYTAFFAQQAAREYMRTSGVEHHLLNAQTYSMQTQSFEAYSNSPAFNLPNLQCPNIKLKQTIFAAYAPWDFNNVHDSNFDLMGDRCNDIYNHYKVDDHYAQWLTREGATSNLASFSATKIANFDGCLNISTNGNANITPCEKASKWSLDKKGQIFVDATHCLIANPLSFPYRSTQGIVQTGNCQSTINQIWTVLNNGQIRGNNGLCLTAENNGVFTQECAQLTDQAVYPPYGRFNQRWAKETGDTIMQKTVSVGTNVRGNLFSDAEFNWDTNVANYSTFRIADINNDGRPDMCGLRPDGVYCATMNADGTYSGSTRWTTAISSASLTSPGYAMSFQLGDINGDKKADVCIRDSNGIKCAVSDGKSFAAVTTLWTKDFSDAQGWGRKSTYQGSLRLVDINQDGYADICGRGIAGIWCALNDKAGKFSPMTNWITAFDDASGWSDDQYGLTIQFADVTGDGSIDVCGRGSSGIYCAVADITNNRFIGFGRWGRMFSDGEGWNKPQYYQSIHLADVDGDGKADVCGRGQNGIFCAISRGNGFLDTWNFPISREFSDKANFGTVAKASSMLFHDINGDGQADICGRSSQGYICTLSSLPYK